MKWRQTAISLVGWNLKTTDYRLPTHCRPGVRVRNWPIAINYSSYIRLWLVNFLLLQPHPYCYCSL